MQDQVLGGRYRVLRSLGAGGMGVVYAAKDQKTSRRVAVKLLLGSLFGLDAGEVASKRFLREAKTIASLQSPNVIEVFDAGRDADTGRLFIAMELLEGTDLAVVLKRFGRLTPNVALRVVGQACAGLAAAHAIGILHRDMKPGNVFLAQAPDGSVTVKLLDFGIAKVTNDPKLTQITGSEEIIGTPAYMAPEQARGLSKADARSDVWAAGAILYKALSGVPPHGTTGSIVNQMIELCTKPVTPLHARAPWLPARLCALVDRALRAEPAERYRDANELLAAIRVLQPDLALNVSELASADTSVMATEVPVSATVLMQPKRSRRGVVLGGLLALGTAVGIGVWLLAGRTTPAVRAETPPPTSVAMPAALPSRVPPATTATSVASVPSAAPVEVGPTRERTAARVPATTQPRNADQAKSEKATPPTPPPALTMAPAFE